MAAAMMDFLKTAENIIVLTLNKDGEILFCNSGFKKLYNIKNEKLKILKDYFVNNADFKNVDLSSVKELVGEKFLVFPYIDKTLTINAKIYEDGSDFIFLGEVRNYTDLKVVEKMSRLTSELASKTRELHKKNQKIKEKDNVLIAQSRSVAMAEMTTMLGHQWRQPLAVISMIISNIELDLVLEELTNDKLKNSMLHIRSIGEDLSKTINIFSNLISSEKEKKLVSVHDVLNDSLSMISTSMENDNIKIILDIQDDTKINIYSKELLQVFISIITNASEALLKNRQVDGYIRIEMVKESETIITRFYNNGGNIDSENLIKIFEPYFSTKYEKNKVGLGLYVSKIILEKHMKGSIKVENTQDGVCFSIEIPYEG